MLSRFRPRFVDTLVAIPDTTGSTPDRKNVTVLFVATLAALAVLVAAPLLGASGLRAWGARHAGRRRWRSCAGRRRPARLR